MMALYPASFKYSWCHAKRKEEGILLAGVIETEVLRDATDLVAAGLTADLCYLVS